MIAAGGEGRQESSTSPRADVLSIMRRQRPPSSEVFSESGTRRGDDCKLEIGFVDGVWAKVGGICGSFLCFFWFELSFGWNEGC